MLDILDLASDFNKQKRSEKDLLSKNKIFEQLYSKLKQRNNLNQNYIKQYLKKNQRKQNKLQFTLTLKQNHQKLINFTINNQQQFKQHQLNYISNRQDNSQLDQIQIKKTQLFKINQLKQTNHTITQIFIGSNQQKKLIIPTINIRQQTQCKKIKQYQDNNNNQNNQSKCDKKFTQYLRNFFLNKVIHKSRLKEKQQEQKMKPRKSYHLKAYTQVENDVKYKLKIKSLVFGHSQVVCSENLTDKKYQKQHFELNQRSHSKKYDEDDRNNLLPTIQNHLYSKNKRCLENYIRLFHQKNPKEKPDFRTIKLPTQIQLKSQQNSVNRRGILQKLKTMHMGK